MLAVISPAKTLDFETTCPPHQVSQPQFMDEAETLISVLKKQSRPQLQELMGISEKLADLNFQRFKEWSRPFTEDNARAALLAFKGDVYTGFSLNQYGLEDFQFVQKHLRILSGLYGVLRPMDLIQPYRLEMGSKLKTSRGANLYEFWGKQITDSINSAFRASGSKTLINLASQEYFSSIQVDKLEGEIITPIFKDRKNGDYKIISFYAKKARGMMCDFMTLERITEPSGLKDFKNGGYSFNISLSEGSSWVFTREEK